MSFVSKDNRINVFEQKCVYVTTLVTIFDNAKPIFLSSTFETQE